MLLAMVITHPNSHTKNVDAQQCGGVVANIHIGDVVMHHGICEAINFELQWKRKREKEHDTNVKNRK